VSPGYQVTSVPAPPKPPSDTTNASVISKCQERERTGELEQLPASARPAHHVYDPIEMNPGTRVASFPAV
jgi:hypothetical protein